MLVNPKKISAIVIDKDNQKMTSVNSVRRPSDANIIMILFKKLETKADVQNLAYSLVSEYYSASFANWIIRDIVQKIKQYFVTYQGNTSVLNWNKPEQGLYAIVLDPTYTKANNQTFDNFKSLVVGGFNPEIARSFTFKNETIRQNEIMRDNWKLESYQSNVRQNANNISITLFMKAIKFMLGEHKTIYKFTKQTPPKPASSVSAPSGQQ